MLNLNHLLVTAALLLTSTLATAQTLYHPTEFPVPVETTPKNPFDPAELAIDGLFTHTDGTRLLLPAYYDGKQFRLRFTPTKPGTWTLETTLATREGKKTLPKQSFTAAPSDHPGFLRPAPNNRYFQTDTGKPAFLVGLNLCWPAKDGLGSYDRRFAKLASVGGNFARIWTRRENAIENKSAGLGRFDTVSATYYDDLFTLAAKHNIRTMWTFDDYRVLVSKDYFNNEQWALSPYNAANGGPISNPHDFFTDPACKQIYKNKLRYLVARYSALPTVAFFELFNEQDHIGKRPDGSPAVPTEWFREMTAYLASIDPYHHIITTSYSWQDIPEVWHTKEVGLTQRHLYGQGDKIDFVGAVIEDSKKYDQYDKPHLIGEFGITWKEPDLKLDTSRKGTPLHDALWSSLLTGQAGTALTWWWDNYLEPANLWHTYTGISKFTKDLNVATKNFRPTTPPKASAPEITVLALKDEASGETLLWLHDPDSNWKNDAEGLEPKTWQNITLPLTGQVEIWDTRKGEILQTLQAKGTITLPEFQRDIALKLRP